MANRPDDPLWWTALVLACAAAAGQQGHDEGHKDNYGVYLLPTSSSPESSPATFDFLLSTPHSPHNEPPPGQFQQTFPQPDMAPTPAMSYDANCDGPTHGPHNESSQPRGAEGSPPAKKSSKKGSKAKGRKNPPPCPSVPAADGGAAAAAALQAPAVNGTSVSEKRAMQHASREQQCVFLCLINVACSAESPQCDTKVFLAGSDWCRFYYECPASQPPFTVNYIPYKPLDAPTSTGSEAVTVDLPADALPPAQTEVQVGSGNVSVKATTTPRVGRPPPAPQSASSPAPQCYYVCEREICSSDTCEVVTGTDFCTFWAVCPLDPPSSRIINLPKDADTDPPGALSGVAGAPTPGPMLSLDSAAAHSPVSQDRLGG